MNEYRNISNTKKCGILYKYSKKELYIYTKCSVSLEFFIKHCFKNSLSELEIKIIQLLENKKYNSLLSLDREKEDEIEFILDCFALYFTTFKKERIVGVFSISNLDNIIRLYQKMPFFLKEGVNKLTKTNISFENGSSIRNIKYGKYAGMGYQIHAFIFKNFESTNKFSNILHNIFPVMVSIADSACFVHFYWKGISERKVLENNILDGVDVFTKSINKRGKCSIVPNYSSHLRMIKRITILNKIKKGEL